jgi:8-oxo-dGTP diphosphatase
MKVTVDLVIRRGKNVLFIRRGNQPFKGSLALPGGFVNEDETVEHAAARELEEETSVRVAEDQLRLIGVFSRVDRDPRGRTISIAYFCEMPRGTRARAGDDAADAVWLPPTKAARVGLAFDHAAILEAAERLQQNAFDKPAVTPPSTPRPPARKRLSSAPTHRTRGIRPRPSGR